MRALLLQTSGAEEERLIPLWSFFHVLESKAPFRLENDGQSVPPWQDSRHQDLRPVLSSSPAPQEQSQRDDSLKLMQRLEDFLCVSVSQPGSDSPKIREWNEGAGIPEVGTEEYKGCWGTCLWDSPGPQGDIQSLCSDTPILSGNPSLQHKLHKLSHVPKSWVPTACSRALCSVWPPLCPSHLFWRLAPFISSNGWASSLALHSWLYSPCWCSTTN